MASRGLRLWGFGDVDGSERSGEGLRGHWLGGCRSRLWGRRWCHGCLCAGLDGRAKDAVHDLVDGVVGHIGFDDMFNTVESVLEKHSGLPHPELEDYDEADQWARSAAKEYIDKAVKQ